MYLINFEVLIQQLLPPLWRNTWRVELFRVLVVPFMRLYDQLHAYQRSIVQGVYRAPQLLVLESLLSSQAEVRVFVTQSRTPFAFDVRVPVDLSSDKVRLIRALVDQYKLAGTTFYYWAVCVIVLMPLIPLISLIPIITFII